MDPSSDKKTAPPGNQVPAAPNAGTSSNLELQERTEPGPIKKPAKDKGRVLPFAVRPPSREPPFAGCVVMEEDDPWIEEWVPLPPLASLSSYICPYDQADDSEDDVSIGEEPKLDHNVGFDHLNCWVAPFITSKGQFGVQHPERPTAALILTEKEARKIGSLELEEFNRLRSQKSNNPNLPPGIPSCPLHEENFWFLKPATDRTFTYVVDRPSPSATEKSDDGPWRVVSNITPVMTALADTYLQRANCTPPGSNHWIFLQTLIEGIAATTQPTLGEIHLLRNRPLYIEPFPNRPLQQGFPHAQSAPAVLQSFVRHGLQSGLPKGVRCYGGIPLRPDVQAYVAVKALLPKPQDGRNKRDHHDLVFRLSALLADGPQFQRLINGRLPSVRPDPYTRLVVGNTEDISDADLANHLLANGISLREMRLWKPFGAIWISKDVRPDEVLAPESFAENPQEDWGWKL